jgi:hypothetical protein
MIEKLVGVYRRKSGSYTIKILPRDFIFSIKKVTMKRVYRTPSLCTLSWADGPPLGGFIASVLLIAFFNISTAGKHVFPSGFKNQ